MPSLAALVAVGLLFALFPAAAAAGGLALAPVLAVAAIIAFQPSALWRAIRERPVFTAFLLAFLVWSIASTLYSPVTDHGQALRLAGVAAVGLIFLPGVGAPEAARMIRAAALAAVIVLIALLCVEAVLDAPLNAAAQPDAPLWVVQRNPARGASALIAMIWGVLAAQLARGGRASRALAGLVFLASAALSTQFNINANAVAFGVGGAAFVLGWGAPRATLSLIVAGLTAWLLLSPLLAPLIAQQSAWMDALPETWAIRAEMWRFTAEEIARQPILGRGLDASRTYTEMIPFRGGQIEALSLHPHSASLQIWLETGAIGALLAAGALIAGGFALWKTLATHRAGAAAACGALASVGIIANVSYGAWQEWWIAAAFIAAATVSAAAQDRQGAQSVSTIMNTSPSE